MPEGPFSGLIGSECFEASLWFSQSVNRIMSAKRNKKRVRAELVVREKAERSFTLEQPIQTAFYAKLERLGYET